MINRLMFIITMGKVTFQTRIVASLKCKCTSINVGPNGTYIHPRLYLVFSCLHEIILIVFFKKTLNGSDIGKFVYYILWLYGI